MKHDSGSPASWKARRVEYQKRSGPVSNPGQPSPCNREARRKSKQPKTVGTIGLRPGAGALLAAMVMLASPETNPILDLPVSDES